MCKYNKDDNLTGMELFYRCQEYQLPDLVNFLFGIFLTISVILAKHWSCSIMQMSISSTKS